MYHSSCSGSDGNTHLHLLHSYHGETLFSMQLGPRLTPLQQACWNGRVDVVNVLVGEGAPLDALSGVSHLILRSL